MIALKELRETNTGLQIIDKLDMVQPSDSNQILLKESNELISIFMQSVKTARINMKKENKY